MSQYSLLESLHGIKGLDPVADALAGTVTSDVVHLAEAQRCLFLIHKGVGATGVSTITVEACSNNTPSATSAVPFRYKAVTTNDVQGAIQNATTSGFAVTAGSSQLYMVEVNVQELLASGYDYVRLKAVESVDSPVLAGIIILLDGLRFGPSATASFID